MGTTCEAVWDSTGDPATGADDAKACAMQLILNSVDDSGLCTVGGVTSLTKDVNLLGRLQQLVTGRVVSADCLADGKAPRTQQPACGQSGLAGGAQNIKASIAPCHESAVICEEESPFDMLSCTQIIQFGLAQCNNDAGDLQDPPVVLDITVGQKCPIACDECPVGPDHNVYTTSDAEGYFTLPVPFTHADKREHHAFLTMQIAVEGHTPVEVSLPLEEGAYDIGRVYVAKAAPLPAADVVGRCLMYHASEPHFGAEVWNKEILVELTPDHQGWPVDSHRDSNCNTHDECLSNVCTGGSCAPKTTRPLEDGTFVFTDIPPGSHSVTCTATPGSATESIQHYQSNGFYTLGPVGHTMSSGQKSGGNPLPPQLLAQPASGFVATLAWHQLSGEYADIDLHAVFDPTSEDGDCHIFYGTRECGNGKLLFDGPDDNDDQAIDTTGNTEVIALNELYNTVYTFYVHNTKAARIMVDNGGETVGRRRAQTAGVDDLMDVTAEVFGNSGKLLHIDTSLETLSQPYLRLFCIDATLEPPAIHSAVQYTDSPPSVCTSCPC